MGMTGTDTTDTMYEAISLVSERVVSLMLHYGYRLERSMVYRGLSGINYVFVKPLYVGFPLLFAGVRVRISAVPLDGVRVRVVVRVAGVVLHGFGYVSLPLFEEVVSNVVRMDDEDSVNKIVEELEAIIGAYRFTTEMVLRGLDNMELYPLLRSRFARVYRAL